jgi:hypothetical protein
MDAMRKIIEVFMRDVRGKKLSTNGANPKHDGAKGHNLERLFGIKANGNNAPDLHGYELKSQTGSKTTFGDWSAELYLFKGKDARCSRTEFIEMFGSPNAEKNNRYSWSGSCFPKVGRTNDFGQNMEVSADGDVSIYYSYSRDSRSNKQQIIATEFQVDNLMLAHWPREKLANHVNRKFNDKGWFKVLADESGTCVELVFGKPMNYETWIELVRQGIIYLDSGMYVGNSRPYSNWRASNNLWDSLIVRRIS